MLHCRHDPLKTCARVSFDLVLPQPDYCPSCAPQLPEITLVSPDITGDLALPVFRELQAPNRKTPAVEEVAVDEYCYSGLSDHEIGSPRQVAGVLLE